MSRRRSLAIPTALALAAASLALTARPAAAEADPTPVDKLGAHDRALLDRYERQHDSARRLATGVATPDFATLLIAVADGRTAEAERALAELGVGTSRTEASVGYLKANVPFDLVERVAALESVVAVDLDELLEVEDTRADGGLAAEPKPGAVLPQAPSATTPDDNPYMPTRETGSTAFKAEHPAFDGRGVTIGVMDTGVDPTHPALAKTTTGEDKLVETVTGTDPNNFIDLLFDSSWFLLGKHQAGPTVLTPDGQAWTAPLDSDLRVQNRALVMPGGEQKKIGVLFRDSDGAIWVDTDGDFDFTDEEAMRRFGEGRQIGYLGTDDPATPLNERVPFTVQWKKINATTMGVNVNVITEAHGTHVAGITAANGMYGGAMDGQAPGAKLVSMKACHSFGCSSAALTDGMIDLATKYGVDVINMSIGSSPELNDGQSARALVYNRLVDATGVQLFISAGNSGAGTNTVGDPTGADRVVSVGAAVSSDTWWANYGSPTKDARAMFPFSSRGPREDGGFKPDITAPGAAVSTTPDWIAPASVPETGYRLPPGYSMMNGTSMSSPQAAGAGALLLSAAKQTGASATPAELRAAIYSTAGWNGKAEAVAQGRGQFDVPKAWSVLGKGQAGTADAVTVSAPVCTPLSGKLVTPHRGSGLFNSCAPGAGGQAVGEERTYRLTVTRTTGAEGPVTYGTGLKGGDGTFSVPASVVLAKGVPTTLEVTAKPGSQGVHSAVLTLDDPATRAVEQHAMLAVEAAVPLAVGGTPLTVTGVTYRNGTVHYTVAVPAGAQALTVSMDGLDEGSQTRWWAFRPTGVSGEKSAAGTIYCYNGYLDGYGCDPKSRTYAQPAAGVWELVVEARRTSPLWANPYALTATVS
ncbi:S8 family serine peptidase [Streptomyces sp. NK15101]|uniref:S8 family serine peptidase n=1 Tax=Streptomyces sp. NK15101 TaxID=2873261 RepID=UPI001CEC415B|nr:S8 family serine peptidase [Streptomyces sp. NK15101]